MTAFQLLTTFRYISLLRVCTRDSQLTAHSSVLGTAGLVFYTYPLLGIIFAPLTVFYYITAVFYRRSSVEVKRLDSLMRSVLYGSYQGNVFLSRPFCKSR